MAIFYTKTHEENRSKFVGSFQMGGESDTGDWFLVRETKFKMTQWVSCCGHHFLTIWNHPIESKRGNLDDMTTPRPHFFKFKRIASDVFFFGYSSYNFSGCERNLITYQGGNREGFQGFREIVECRKLTGKDEGNGSDFILIHSSKKKIQARHPSTFGMSNTHITRIRPTTDTTYKKPRYE